MGFKTEQFVENVNENLICGICLEVLEDPWQCKDGHIFCKDCITRSLEVRQVCPMDNNALQLGSLGRSLAVKNIIENLNVYCHPAESDGQGAAKDVTEESELKCEWTGKLQSLDTHRETCPFQQVQCPNGGCLTIIQKRELEYHDKICGYKRVKCVKCGQVILQCNQKIHKTNYCPEELILCPNSCRDPDQNRINKIKRRNKREHLTDFCAKTILDCPFKDQGCSVQVERQHVEKHVQDNMAAHMMLLAKQCSLLTEQNLSLDKQCSSLAEQNSSLAKQCSSLTKQNSSLTEQCSELTKQYLILSQGNQFLMKELNQLKVAFSARQGRYSHW